MKLPEVGKIKAIRNNLPRHGCRAASVCLSVILIASGGCSPPGGGEGDDGGKPAQPVTVTAAEAATLRETVSGIGSFEAPSRVEIRAEIGGLVREVAFEEGQRVVAGDLLYQLEDQELQRRQAARSAALEAAQAERTNAEWNFERIRELYEKEVAAVEEYKNARDELDAARARVEQVAAELRVVEAQLEDTRIRAPMAGRVTEQLVDVGDFVDTGERLTGLYAFDPIELTFQLPERYANQVQPDQAVTARSPAYGDREFVGELIFVSPGVDPQTRTLRVKAAFANPDEELKPGVFATAQVTLARREQIVIPEECLVSRRGGYSVFVVNDGVAHLRQVEVGLRRPGQVGIRAGLEPGDRVIRTGHMQLVDGDRVRVAEEDGGEQAATQPATTRAAAEERRP